VIEHTDSPAAKAFMKIVEKIEDFLKGKTNQINEIRKEEVS
jgi:hypothetical protein